MTAAEFQAIRERVELDVASGLVLDQPEEDRKALVGEVVRLRVLLAAIVSEVTSPPVCPNRVGAIISEALR